MRKALKGEKWKSHFLNINSTALVSELAQIINTNTQPHTSRARTERVGCQVLFRIFNVIGIKEDRAEPFLSNSAISRKLIPSGFIFDE